MKKFVLKNKRIFISRPTVSSEFFQVPKMLIKPDGYDLYYADRQNNRSLIKKLTFTSDFQLTEKDAETVLRPSEVKGTFDDEGVMPACILTSDDRNYMFYSGWNSRNSVPYHNATGLADITSKGCIRRRFQGPVLDRGPDFPFLAVTPTVWGTKGSYHCIYVNGDGWIEHKGTQEVLYSMKYAVSNDLKIWDRRSHSLIEEPDGRVCHSNPCHFRYGTETFIAYCARKPLEFRTNSQNSYVLRIAEWNIDELRLEPCELEIDAERIPGFDDEMMAYPEVFPTSQGLRVLYNGNGFGRAGIGILDLEKL